MTATVPDRFDVVFAALSDPTRRSIVRRLADGVRLWDGLEALEQQYDVDVVSTPSGVTHLTFTR